MAKVVGTCAPENPAQLPPKVQATYDSTLLREFVPELQEYIGLVTLYANGGYGSTDDDLMLEKKRVTLSQMAIRGRMPRDLERMYLDDRQVKRAGVALQ